MALRVCAEHGCPELTASSRCPTHARAKDKARGSTSARGYGPEHRAERAKQLPDAIGKPCHFCGQPMRADQALALDHTPDRSGYRGMAHANCNASDGARRGNTMR